MTSRPRPRSPKKAALYSCPGLHLPPPRPTAVELDWRENSRFISPRVKQVTCSECSSTWYELCVGGGLVFIRRARPDPKLDNRLKIEESPAWPHKEGYAMWKRLITGHFY